MGKCGGQHNQTYYYTYSVAILNIMVGPIALIGGIVVTIYNPFLIYYALAIIQGILWMTSSVIFFTGEIMKKNSFIFVFFVLSLICWCVCCLVMPFVSSFWVSIACFMFLIYHSQIWRYYKEKQMENSSGGAEGVAKEEEQLQ